MSSEDFERSTGPFRRELLAHCYHMLGSAHDAEDLLQETLLRAWRAHDRFDARRATLRTWLYHIATNACLNALESRQRRPLPSGHGPASYAPEGTLARAPEVLWLQPCPDAWLGTDASDPARALASRGHLRLAFVAAKQFLPARQRAVVILRDALDFSAAEAAEILGMTEVAVNSALQRARSRLADPALRVTTIDEPGDSRSRALVDRYVTAFQAGDISALKQLLAHDVILEMPPYADWFSGPEPFGRLIERVRAEQGAHWRFERTAANGQPALAAYVRGANGTYRIHSLQVLAIEAGAIVRTSAFQDARLYDLFDLKATLQ